jgi:NUDIX domain
MTSNWEDLASRTAVTPRPRLQPDLAPGSAQDRAHRHPGFADAGQAAHPVRVDSDPLVRHVLSARPPAPSRPAHRAGPEAPRANSLVPAVNVVVVNDAGEILLIRRTDNRQLGRPGGAIDLGESVAQAAVRETLEESGIECAITDYPASRWTDRCASASTTS